MTKKIPHLGLQYVLFFGLLLTVTSCNEFTIPNPIIPAPITCTKIGCTDGISLALSESLPDTAVIEVSWEGSSQTLSCAKGRCSGNFVFLDGITPEQLSVKISNGNAVLHESSHTPNYTVNKPNGPDCPPECKQAKIDIAI